MLLPEVKESLHSTFNLCHIKINGGLGLGLRVSQQEL